MNLITMSKQWGTALNEMIKARRWTVAELSQKSGVSKNTITGWLSQNKEPSISQLKKVSNALGESLHKIAFGEPDPHEDLSREVLKKIFEGDVRVTISQIGKSQIGEKK